MWRFGVGKEGNQPLPQVVRTWEHGDLQNSVSLTSWETPLHITTPAPCSLFLGSPLPGILSYLPPPSMESRPQPICKQFCKIHCRIIRGNSDQNLLPCPGKIVTTYMSYLTTQNSQVTTNQKNSRKSKGDRRQTPVHKPYWPPRILLAGAMCVPPARTLSQMDWPKTTWKLIPSP